MDLWLILILAVPVWMIGMFVFISWLVSRFGWNRLAELYPDRDLGPSESWIAPFVGVGLLSQYRGVVRVQTDQLGARFSTVWLFKVGHRPFVVPWADMTVSSGTGFLQRLTFARMPERPLRVFQKTIDRLESAAGRPLHKG